MKTGSILVCTALAAFFAASAQNADLQQKLEQGFKAFDLDKDAALSAAEFQALCEYSPKLKGKPQVADYLFHTLDANRDSKLTHDEYMNIAAFSGGNQPSSTPAKPAEDQIAFFEKKIRPVLSEKCYKCHAADAEKIKGGLVLDTREGIRKGGETGPGIVPGDPTKSLVLESIRYTNKDLQMPPEKHGGKLPDSVIADFEQWIRMGAADPREGKAALVKSDWDTEKAKNHWAWQPVKSTPAPSVKNTAWPKSDIDRFILAGLEQKGLQSVPDAKPETLLRRLYFDLIGLPPTPEEVARFLSDLSDKSDPSDAYERVIDSLLQSPRFGERWARHWLDVARYAESSGKDVNCLYPHAWRYRDYVIEAFNSDKPFNDFIREQIAGDLMSAPNSRDRAMKQIATGFLAIGSRSLNERSPVQYALDIADEQIDAVSQAVLGLTVACARCHDHKFDPIPQRDYYALAGIFLSTETLYGTEPTFQNIHASPLVELPTDCGLPRMPLTLSPERRAEIEKDLTKTERYAAVQFYTTAAKALFTGKGFDINNDPQKLVLFVGINAKIGQSKNELASYDSEGRQKLLAMGVRDYPATPPAPRGKPKSLTETFESVLGRPAKFSSLGDGPLFMRGDAEKPGEKVPRGFLSLVPAKTAAISSKESGRRELANWLVSDENPLTARVFANRVWNWLFGRGIVSTVDNFGTMGQPPSNPALLDHLALRLQANGWSVKKLIKEIVMSRAYQLASTHDAKCFEADPENTLLWRMSPRRLDAECIRDAMLAISGSLKPAPTGSAVAQHGDASIGGYPIKSLRTPLADEPFLTATGDFRSIYLPVPRNAVPDALTVFDFAEPSAVNGTREVTTVPSQALYLLNNDFVTTQAKRLAEKLRALPANQRVSAAFQLAFARVPTASEIRVAERFLTDGDASLTSFCRALLASAEFRSVD